MFKVGERVFSFITRDQWIPNTPTKGPQQLNCPANFTVRTIWIKPPSNKDIESSKMSVERETPLLIFILNPFW